VPTQPTFGDAKPADAELSISKAAATASSNEKKKQLLMEELLKGDMNTFSRLQTQSTCSMIMGKRRNTKGSS
jgi:hypothetical protein